MNKFPVPPRLESSRSFLWASPRVPMLFYYFTQRFSKHFKSLSCFQSGRSRVPNQWILVNKPLNIHWNSAVSLGIFQESWPVENLAFMAQSWQKHKVKLRSRQKKSARIKNLPLRNHIQNPASWHLGQLKVLTLIKCLILQNNEASIPFYLQICAKHKSRKVILRCQMLLLHF